MINSISIIQSCNTIVENVQNKILCLQVFSTTYKFILKYSLLPLINWKRTAFEGRTEAEKEDTDYAALL